MKTFTLPQFLQYCNEFNELFYSRRAVAKINEILINKFGFSLLQEINDGFIAELWAEKYYVNVMIKSKPIGDGLKEGVCEISVQDYFDGRQIELNEME